MEVGDDVDICFGLDNCHDFEYHECFEDHGDLGVVMDVGIEMEIGDLLDDAGDSLCVESKGDLTILDGQSIWGLTCSSQGIPRMME